MAPTVLLTPQVEAMKIARRVLGADEQPSVTKKFDPKQIQALGQVLVYRKPNEEEVAAVLAEFCRKASTSSKRSSLTGRLMEQLELQEAYLMGRPAFRPSLPKLRVTSVSTFGSKLIFTLTGTQVTVACVRKTEAEVAEIVRNATH